MKRTFLGVARIQSDRLVDVQDLRMVLGCSKPSAATARREDMRGLRIVCQLGGRRLPPGRVDLRFGCCEWFRSRTT
jgi:hypothetical protein